MLCHEVEVVLEKEGLSPLPAAARAHVSGCSSCRSLIADLGVITELAHELPAEIEPPQRVWNALRAQLESDGVIKTPAAKPAPSHAGFSRWLGFSDLFRTRALACATLGFLVAFAVIAQWPRTGVSNIAQNAQLDNPYTATSTALNDDERLLPATQVASVSTVDASLRENLAIVDQFIAECEQRVKEQPGDELALTYLTGAYQQKAELLSAMMEREGSGN